MKNILLAALLSTSYAFAADTVIPNNKVKLGQASSSGDKIIEFNTNSGSANPKIKVTPATNRIQFANDGANFRDLGSGSGGGSGINLLSNGGFETGVADGWTSSGGTFAAVTSGINLLYQTTSASFVATLTGQFFESSAITVPQILFGQDCMIKVSYKGADANGYLTVLDGSSVELIPSVSRATLNSNAGIKSAKVYFNCPSSGSVKIRVQSTAAMAIGYFDEAILGQSDFTGVSGITSDVNYSPVYTGFGTPTAVDIKYSRVGKKLKITARFALGTTTATTASVSLPNGWTVSNKYTSSKIFGLGNRLVQTAATKNYSVIASPNDSTLKFSANGDTQTTNPISPINGTDIGSSGQELVFSAELEINEFPESELVVNSKCPNDIACENVFTAQFSSAGVLLSENLDWINGNATNPSAGNYAIVFNSGIFTTTPICVVNTAISNNFNQSGTISSVSFSNMGVVTGAGGIAVSLQFNVICQKTGADFKAKQNIQAFLTSTITSGGNNLRLETLVIGQASKGITCTSSPCGVFNQSGAVSGVTRSGTGLYAINFLASSFSGVPVCSFSASAGGNINCTESSGSTSSVVNVACVAASTSAAIDAGINVTCMGPR